MYARLLTSVLAAACLGFAATAAAAPGHDRHRHGPPAAHHVKPGHKPHARPAVVHVRPARPAPRVRHAAPPPRWAKGQVLPARYRGGHYVVHDWRRHQLKSPPRGQQWVRVGSEYLLVGVATGMILQAVLSR